MPGREARRTGGEEPDLPLSHSDVDVLQDELSRIFSTEPRATSFLRTVRFPSRLIPAWHSDAYEFWATIFADLSSGAMDAPYRRLIAAALRVYAGNSTLEDILARYENGDGHAADQASPPEPSQPTCHLVVRINSEEELADIERWLTERGLAPEQEWLTHTAVSFRLNQTDARIVREAMHARRDLGFTVVPPGRPDYVLRQIFVDGPDGRSFSVNDVPVQSTVGSVATEVMEHYPPTMPGRERPAVVDLVGKDGSGRRMNPDNTLDEEGVGEGDRFRVGVQQTAAAINPLDRRDALFGVSNQMQEYVDAHPGFKVWANSGALPTEYDVEFTQDSFGPPAVPRGEPPDIRTHQLSIVLGADFPITAPRVRWLTDIFHPNVFPTYESEELRRREDMRGLVCLGGLAESYQPSLHFGDLCATLQDIAGYRNYSVFVPAEGAVDPQTGAPLLRGDYYDRLAAEWAISSAGQERIRKIGGAPVLRVLSGRPDRFGLEIWPQA